MCATYFTRLRCIWTSCRGKKNHDIIITTHTQRHTLHMFDEMIPTRACIYIYSLRIVVVIGELVLDPLEAVPERSLDLTFHGVHVIRSHPLPPLHFWILGSVTWPVEAKRLGSVLKPEPGFHIRARVVWK